MRAPVTNHILRAGRGARIDTLGWGLLFVAIGGVGLVPGLPKDAWLIAAGVVMLGVSLTRALLRLPVRAVTMVVGLVVLAAGIGSLAGLATATGPLVLVVLGLALISTVVYRSQRPTDVAPLSQAG